MKKIWILFLSGFLVIILPSCRNHWLCRSNGTLQIANVGDVAVGLFLFAGEDWREEVLESGESAVYDFSWNGAAGLDIVMEVEDLRDGQVLVENFILLDGEWQDWEVGFLYRGNDKYGGSANCASSR